MGGSLYDPANITLIHHLYAALRAHNLFHRDQHYVVQNGEVVIVDEFTGRLMAGRRWSDGLHQAVEAKEGVAIQKENQTLASITFQNYFRMYDKLAGMTGTADTEAYEFQQIYNLETVIIPPHRPTIRKDMMDKVYLTAKEKYHAVIEDIKDCYERGQPVLVGTTSIENSELLSGLLERDKLPHQVLNAKQHAREAEIVAQAGRPKMVTIATNMAGRGTDIVLGGNVEKQIELVREDASLDEAAKEQRIAQLQCRMAATAPAGAGQRRAAHHRHRAPRVAPRGQPVARTCRSPGRSRLQPFLPVAGRSAVAHLCVRPGGGDHEQIQAARRRGDRAHLGDARDRKCAAQGRGAQLRHAQADSGIRRCRQRPAQGDLPAAQRIAGKRGHYRNHPGDARGRAGEYRQRVHSAAFDGRTMGCAGTGRKLAAEFRLELPLVQWLEEDKQLNEAALRVRIREIAQQQYQAKVEAVGAEVMHHYERAIMLQSLDVHWREHLAALDHLRQGIHLRGYAQKNPKQEYKREAFELFAAMLDAIKRR